jgi:hypothetical protein
MGGDSAGVSHLNVIVRKDPKVFRNGKFLIGYTSSFRMGQLLRYKFTPPPVSKRSDLFQYMCTDFIDAARKVLKKGGYSSVESNVETGGKWLVATQGRLFTIHTDYQVGESVDLYSVVGCGADFALGSLATQPVNDPPEKRVMQSLKIATQFSSGVRPPFILLTL